MHIPKGLVVVLAGLLLSACGGLRPFKDMDVDQDGRIDRVEAKQSTKVLELFESADDDDSGDLEPDEYASIIYVIQRAQREVPRRSGGGGNADVGH